MPLVTILLGAHILAAVFWVGGMSFTVLVLRPSMGALEAPARLALWRQVFGRFFPWVGVAILVLLVSGYGMVAASGGFERVGLYVHIMQGIGILMMLLFGHLLFGPWRRFRTAVDSGTPADAPRQLERIRHIATVNLVLGAITIVVAATGPYW